MKVYKSEAAKKKIVTTYDKLIEAWDIPVKQVEVPTTYGTTHVNVCGKEDGRPLFLFHGVGDDAALMWIYNAKALGKVFRLYAVDTIGGPGKSRPGENYNKDFADEAWIDQIMDYFGMEQADFAGVSHGGYLVQYYALKRPERIRKALCLATSVPVKTGKSRFSGMMKVMLPEALFPTKANIAKLLAKMCGTNSAAFTDNPLIMEHFTAVMKGFDRKAMLYHKVYGFSDEEIAAIRSKCRYFVGAQDPFMELGGGKMLETYNMDVIFFPEAGHGINHEQAEKMNKLMIDYLGE